jgi:Glycosyl hydrolase family 57
MTTGYLRPFAFFHLNLAYSSIEEEQRPEVVKRCYWPLLRLVRSLQLPIGIEASAYTLQCINEIDPGWLIEFGSLCSEGLCELVGSGNVQLIGPLVPPDVNAANLRLGNEAYVRLLKIKPSIALINEQAYSAGLLQHYINAGYRAIIMEWDNPSRHHPEWSPELRYLPQFARGQHGEEIPLIWNKSIAFQKFQRFVHGEMELDEYLRYLCGHLSEAPRVFPVYGNDVEIFDFRPGRYQTEPALREVGEWQRISRVFEAILKDERFQFILPSKTLDWMDAPGAGKRLSLESPEDPVPVKKQEKYNITRWAVTGRNDPGINTACHRLYGALREGSRIEEPSKPHDESWRELCYLWSSDFRTHITDRRWSAYLKRLGAFETLLGPGVNNPAIGRSTIVGDELPAGFRSQREGRFLKLENDQVQVVLNCRRGLAIDSFVVKKISPQSLFGTLAHGYYQDIALGADYYSGHLVLEAPGQPKITDLSTVDPRLGCADECDTVIVEGDVPSPLGLIRKRIQVNAEGELTLEYKLEWEEMPPGALRLAHVTLNPEAFRSDRLYFESHNGGFLPDRFSVGAKRIEHGRSVSFLVSATSAIGMTSGEFRMGDEGRTVKVRTHQNEACVVAEVTFIPVAGSFFYRASFSAAELDETCRNRPRVDFPRTLAFRITAGQPQSTNSPKSVSAEVTVPK